MELREACELDASDPLIIVGGAPCQPFSKAAYWTEEGKEALYRRERASGKATERPSAPTAPRPDQRRNLVGEFWRIIASSDADGFVFENVPSIRHPRNIEVLEKFVSCAERAGFHVTVVKANAADFGVAQTRERIFVLGSKATQPEKPAPTHKWTKQASNSLPAAVTAGVALAGVNGEDLSEPEIEVIGKWAKQLEEIPPGWNYKALTEWAGHLNPTFVAETRFWNFLLKLSPDRPSWTIAATPGPWTGPFHWDSRRLRTSEMAALQGFPSHYAFCGSRRERVRQIGNAVPPGLASPMIKSVLTALA